MTYVTCKMKDDSKQVEAGNSGQQNNEVGKELVTEQGHVSLDPGGKVVRKSTRVTKRNRKWEDYVL